MESSSSSVEEGVEDIKCRHHYIIEVATGPISLGTCTECKVTKEFKNHISRTFWGDSEESKTPSKKV